MFWLAVKSHWANPSSFYSADAFPAAVIPLEHSRNTPGNLGKCGVALSPMPILLGKATPRSKPKPAAVGEDWSTYTLLRAGPLAAPEPPRSQFIKLGLQLLCTRGDYKIQSTVIIFHSFSSSKCPKYWEDWATDQQRGVLQHDDNGVSCASLSMAQGHLRASGGTRLVLKNCPG